MTKDVFSDNAYLDEVRAMIYNRIEQRLDITLHIGPSFLKEIIDIAVDSYIDLIDNSKDIAPAQPTQEVSDDDKKRYASQLDALGVVSRKKK